MSPERMRARLGAAGRTRYAWASEFHRRQSEMTDPFTEIVGLLRPSAPYAKQVVASGRWSVRRPDGEQAFYCAVLEGACRLSPDGEPSVALGAGDFVLMPAARGFTASSLDPPPPGAAPGPLEVGPGLFRLGPGDGRPDTRMLVGHCAFASHDARLLVSLLPRLVHVRGEARLATLVELVNGETRGGRPGRDAMLARLLEALMIEALRSGASRPDAAAGLMRGLADERVAAALRRMHDDPARAWTVVALARAAGLSRSTFFERFRREVGTAPMDYLLTWRMALAKELLRRGEDGIGRVAERVGYSSASTFSAAFARHAGLPPGSFARRERSA